MSEKLHPPAECIDCRSYAHFGWHYYCVRSAPPRELKPGQEACVVFEPKEMKEWKSDTNTAH